MKYSKLLFTFILLSALSKILNAGDFPFVTNIHINEAAINRFLAKQYNDAGFIKSWSGTFNGNAYSLSIERPVVVLQSNSIVIEIGVTLNNNYYLLRPSITIPPITITSADIKATFIQLQTYLNTVQHITNYWEKDLINQKLNAIQWLIYQGTFLTEPTSTSEYFVLTTTIDSIRTKIDEGTINLNFHFNNHTDRPNYSFYWTRSKNGNTYKWWLKVKSNTKIEIQKVEVHWYGSLIGTFDGLVVSSFNADQNKYIATVGVNTSMTTTSFSGMTYKIKLARSGYKTLWGIDIPAGTWDDGSTFITPSSTNLFVGE